MLMVLRLDLKLKIPEEIIISRVERHEEMMQKVTDGCDQMYIEDGVQGNEEVEFVDLI